ncbi:MAG: hypothetical protein KGL50_02290, partial [Burkholderiales bacterium]|nr:hypothetical protein [Burkholderiales bacterium]
MKTAVNAALRAAIKAAMVAGLVVAAGPARADEAAERADIARQRQALLADFATREAACREHFVVSACVEALREQRDRALRSLRQRELLLDDADRRRRSAQAREDLARRAAAAAARSASAAAQDEARAQQAQAQDQAQAQ